MLYIGIINNLFSVKIFSIGLIGRIMVVKIARRRKSAGYFCISHKILNLVE